MHIFGTFLSRLARLRWKYALHTLGTRDQKFVLQSGGLGQKGTPEALMRKAQMVERLKGAAMLAEKRKRAHGIKRKAEDYHTASSFMAVVKVGRGCCFVCRRDLELRSDQ